MVYSFLSNFPGYLLYLILFNFFIILLGLVLVYVYNLSSSIYKKRNKNLETQFIKLLRELLLAKKDIELSDLKPFIDLGVQRQKKIREIFIESLTQYSCFLGGNEARNIEKIYTLLDLQKAKIKDLSSIFNSAVIQAIDELTRFKVPVEREIMVQLQKKENSMIRELANSYTLTIYKDNIYDFFSFNDDRFTKWKHLTYFQLIINRTDLKKPHFGQWISPEFKSTVISLAMDLASYYYQQNAAENIHAMLNTLDCALRFQMINNLGKLNNPSSPEVLMKLFVVEKDKRCKREIIKSLGYMTHNTSEVTHFLKTTLAKENSINLKKAIIIALKRTTSDSTIPSIYFPEFEHELQLYNT